MLVECVFFLFQQKTAYELRISDWSSDVCSSDLLAPGARAREDAERGGVRRDAGDAVSRLGGAERHGHAGGDDLGGAAAAGGGECRLPRRPGGADRTSVG